MGRIRWYISVAFLVATAGDGLIPGKDAKNVRGESRTKRGENLAPYVPTPMSVVDKMLALAAVTRNDRVYDLGCGDGRIVVAAAKQYGARAVGVDYDPARIAEARKRAQRHKVEHLVTLIEHDALTLDFSDATVVTLYLLPSSNEKLKPRFANLLPPGTRIVSHDFRVPGWTPVRSETVVEPSGRRHRIFLYRNPGGRTLSGIWVGQPNEGGGNRLIHLCLREADQLVTGYLLGPAARDVTPLKFVLRRGNQVEIRAGSEAEHLNGASFIGKLKRDRIVGRLYASDGGGMEPWTFRRQPVNLDGEWIWSEPQTHGDRRRFALNLKRTPQGIDGLMTIDDETFTIINPRTEDSQLQFDVWLSRGPNATGVRYRGWIEGQTIVGTMQRGHASSQPQPWRAHRTSRRSDS